MEGATPTIPSPEVMQPQPRYGSSDEEDDVEDEPDISPYEVQFVYMQFTVHVYVLGICVVVLQLSVELCP